MPPKTYHVLFLSQRNTAWSILAEAILNRDGRGRFRGHSAAIAPPTKLDPLVTELMQSAGLSTQGLRSKHFREFSEFGQQELDFVFTLSDTAAGEAIPQWPGMPVTAHWSSPDPMLVEGADGERKIALTRIMSELERRLRTFMNLPFESLDRMSLKTRVDEIGRNASLPS